VKLVAVTTFCFAVIYSELTQHKKITDTNQPNGKTSSRPAIQSIASTPTHHHRGDDMQAITPNTNPKKSQHIKFGINKLGTLLSSQTTDTLDSAAILWRTVSLESS
jgi:hypothetical protein